MNRPVLATLVLLLLGAKLEHAGAEEFRFAWPVPAVATVVSEAEKDGVASTARYVIRLAAADDSELALDFTDFELLTLNGEDAHEPRIAAQLAPLAAVTAALPTIRLTPDGEYRGTRSLNLMLQRILALLPEDMDPAQRDQLARGLRSPAMQTLMQQKSGEVWNLWVGAWNGLVLEAGEELSGTTPITVMGRDIEQRIVIEHLGVDADYPGSARLRMTTVLEGPEVLALLGRIEQETAGRAGDYCGASSRNVTEVTTRAPDLLPYRVQSDTAVVVRDASGRAHRQRERKVYRFKWQ